MSKSKYKYTYDYTALYPGVEINGKVLKALKQSDRKIKYYEYDLKYEPFVVDEETGALTFHPSREDSLDRLLEMDKQFRDESALPEELVIEALYIQVLRRCISLLDEEERALIHALFYEGLTELAYGNNIGLAQKNINKYKQRILGKMRKILEISIEGV